jgi:RimJ/RimL family protein N-acetyltransferase
LSGGPEILERIRFTRLVEPTPEIADTISGWENNPDLIPYIRPNKSSEDLQRRERVSALVLTERLEHVHIYLIYRSSRLIGEMNFQVDPAHLIKKEPGTAWISITIGEPRERGKGIGQLALEFLEAQIAAEGLERIELGVFEFNAPAIALYKKLGYIEIGRLADFTYWCGRMWDDIRMEKYLKKPT